MLAARTDLQVSSGSGGVPEGVPERSGAGFRSGFRSISAAASGAVPERVPRSLRPKPLCQALQDAWSPKTRAYSVLCLMPYAVLAQGLLW